MGSKPEEVKVNGVIQKHWCYVVIATEEYRGPEFVVGVFDDFKDAEPIAMQMIDKSEYVEIYMMERNRPYDVQPNKSAFGYWSVFSFKKEYN